MVGGAGAGIIEESSERNKVMKATRVCGECHACCYAMGCEDEKLRLDPGELCQHCRLLPSGRVGCAIYPQRPAICKRFACLWADGWLPEYARPDKIGIVFFLTNGEMNTVVVYELKVNAWVENGRN